jgi:hypothetical protein
VQQCASLPRIIRGGPSTAYKHDSCGPSSSSICLVLKACGIYKQHAQAGQCSAAVPSAIRPERDERIRLFDRELNVATDPIQHQAGNLQIVLVEHEHMRVPVDANLGQVQESDVAAFAADAGGKIGPLRHRRGPS